jgi:hypothetical protein
MPEEESAPAPPKRKRRRWRRVLKGLLWLVLALVALHWPLVILGGPVVARFFAGREGLDVKVKIAGSIWSSLELRDVEVMPNGRVPTPVEFVRIEWMRLEYSLWRLLREGPGEALSNYELRGAAISIVPMPERGEKREREERKTVAKTLRTILAQPALYSDRAEVVDLSVRVESRNDVVDVRGVNMLFDPVQPGWLRVARLEVPGAPLWQGIDGTATYAQRDLVIENVRLGPDLMIRRLEFDASARRAGRTRVSVLAEAHGGTLEAAMEARPAEQGGEMLPGVRIAASAQNIRLREALETFGVKGVPVDEVARMKLTFAGDPQTPRTWVGGIEAAARGVGVGGLKVPEVKLKADFLDEKAVFSAAADDSGNFAAVKGEIGLPEDVDGWRTVAGSAELTVSAPNAASWRVWRGIVNGMEGSLEGMFGIGWKESVLSAEGTLAARDCAAEGISVSRAEIEASVAIPMREGPRIVLGDLSAGVRIAGEDIARGHLRVDELRAEVEARDGYARLRSVDVRREDNRVTGSGSVHLAGNLKRPTGEVMLEVEAPRVESFGIALGRDVAAGNARGRLHMRSVEGRPEGEAAIAAVLRAGEWSSGEVTLKMRGESGALLIEELKAALGGGDGIVGSGRYSLVDAQAYDGKLALRISDFGKLAELLRVLGIEKEVSGGVDGEWSGEGKLADGVHRGEVRLLASRLRVDGAGVDTAEVAGRYDGGEAAGTLRVEAGPAELKAEVSRGGGWLSLRQMELVQGGQRALSGEISYHLGEDGLAGREFQQQALSVKLAAERLDIEKLLRSFGIEKTAAGTVTASLRAEGPVLRPEVDFVAEARGVKSLAMPEIEPAEVEMKAMYRPGRAEVDARIRQALIEPMVLRAELPLDLEKLVETRKLDPELPLTARVRLPESSLAPLPKLLPAVRRVNGTVALDLEAAGTLGRPRLRGAAVVKLADARMRNESFPPIGKFDARLVFEEEALRFEQFRGEAGGGTFGVTGRIGLAEVMRPDFDLRIEADDVLVMRDDSITVRTDADVRVAGPLDKGRLAGTVFVTQSRFFKEIEILPIALPGRPKPAPRQAPAERTISLPPPLDAWEFDVAIRTRGDDPFRVRGNLANGRVALGLQLGGTGAAPWLEGVATIEQFTGSLPFSTLTIENGRVLFSRQAPFVPTLEIQAESTVRNYAVGASIYGTVNEPKVVLTSEPPLPHADIVSLLATGTTTSELSGSADVLASRAAILAVQSLWRRLFRRGAPPEMDSKNAAQDFLDRFEMELGAVDEKTGAREAITRFRINDQTYIVGELDMEGRYTGSVKYLLRFR